MARSTLNNIQNDLVSDSGSVLWSFVKGEQLEYPVSLDFLNDIYAGYTLEAVVVEADNMPSQLDRPLNIKVGGIQTVLNVRIPPLRGNWNPGQAYNRDDLVVYGGAYYSLANGVARISALTPDVDPQWGPGSPNIIYVQFDALLGSTWAVQPVVGSPVYGFFELRVTENFAVAFKRTWKPVRGMVQILFSPTDIVPDVV